MVCRNLCRVKSVEEGDWSSVQTDPEEPRDQRGTHHNWRLHGTAVHRTCSISSSNRSSSSVELVLANSWYSCTLYL